MDDHADTTLLTERQQFFHGQRLFASDLQELEAFHRGMRELHNRSLHQPGVGNGFAVTGAIGDRELKIGPGYALDSAGREIVLTATHTEQVPPVSAEDDGESVFYDLTVSYPSDKDLEEAETRAGICLPRGVVRLEVEPVICWVRLERDERGKLHARDLGLREDVQQGRKVRLARVEIRDCAIKSLSVEERRNARPAGRPYIACGRAQPEWKQQEDASSTPRNVMFTLFTATVDTTCAGFTTVPCYTARLEDPRGTGLQRRGFLEESSLRIHNPQPDRFDVQIFALAGDTSGNAESINAIPPWEIVWMGVE